jgi:peroxiredoxin
MTYSKSLFIVLLLFSSSVCFSQAQVAKAPANRIAPPFSLPKSDGGVLNLSDLKGSVTLLEFFQTGCVNCQLAAPKLESLYQKYKDSGFVVVSVSFDNLQSGSMTERVRAVEPFIKQFGLTYPVLLGDGSIWKNYIQKPGFSSPFIVFIDRKGMIAGQYEEGSDHKACDIDFLESQVVQLLKGSR